MRSQIMTEYIPDDPFDLARFVAAKEHTFAQALAEVRRGAKRTHWMWFMFPQLAGLVSSEMAHRYAISDPDEAAAYLAHSVLGPCDREVVEALQDLIESDATSVLGEVDAQKLCSSLILFLMVSGDPLFAAALTRWCGQPDPRTVALLS